MPDASLNTMIRIRTTLYNQSIRSASYRAANHIPRGLILATVEANDQRNNKILEQDSYIIPNSPFTKPPKLIFLGPSNLFINTPIDLYFNNTGDPATNYKAQSLPIGLTINSETGIISGTPTVLSGFTDYIIQASNSAGMDTITIQLSVIQQAPNITYSGSPFTFRQGTNISPLYVSNTGGTTNVTYTGTVPNGLSLSSTTGTISGTPTIENIILPSSTSYNITATNSSGSSTATIIVNMNQAAPSFYYLPGPTFIPALSAYFYVIIRKREITPVTALNVFTPITFQRQPNTLSGNLTVNSSTGTISGITYESSSFGFFVEGINSAGQRVQRVDFLPDACPPVFSYSPNTYTFTQNSTITDINIIQDFNVSDGFLNSSISPALPLGLNFDAATAKISGTPLVPSSTQTYTVTAFGLQRFTPQINGTATITITVNPIAPFISYATPPTFTRNVAITPLVPTNTGGAVTSYTAISTLPTGLSIAPSTGIISGIPTVAGFGIYTIQASNITGLSETTIPINISATGTGTNIGGGGGPLPIP